MRFSGGAATPLSPFPHTALAKKMTERGRRERGGRGYAGASGALWGRNNG